MNLKLLEILSCPECGGGLNLAPDAVSGVRGVTVGTLTCAACSEVYPIVAGIPRFVSSHPTDASFGLQWNEFRCEQLDSWNGARLSAERFFSETGWSASDVEGRRILEVGCGAGRFLEALTASTQCDVVGVDASAAIDAAAQTIKGRANTHLVQADIYKLPFRSGSFDGCYCIGVAQHTPEPLKALGALPRMLKTGGKLAVTVYERKPWTLINGKYLLRPLTTRMNRRVLLSVIRGLMPILFPITEILFRVPLVGKVAGFILPVANYVELRDLTLGQRYRLALLDTFDRLAPQYDNPLTESEVRTVLTENNMSELRRLPNSGVNVVGVRGAVESAR